MFGWPTSYKSTPDEVLIPLIARGKEGAFNELYNRYHRRLHYFFYKMLGYDAALADDFLQELFLKVIEKPGLYLPGRNAKTWLYTLATNMCRNEHRRLTVRRQAAEHGELQPAPAAQEKLSATMDAVSFRTELETALAELEDAQRLCFVLRHQEDLSIKEIAEILNLPEGTVKSRLFYTLKKLSVRLHAYNPILA